MGWWRIIALLPFYLELMLFLEKRIHDRNSVDGLVMLQTFSQKDLAPTLFGGADYEGIPEGDAVQPMKVDGGQDISDRRLNDVKACVYLHLLPRECRIDTQFSRGIYKILLEHLDRHYACSLSLVFQHEFKSSCLFCGGSGVLAIEQ
jgi:hypothetical protein